MSLTSIHICGLLSSILLKTARLVCVVISLLPDVVLQPFADHWILKLFMSKAFDSRYDHKNEREYKNRPEQKHPSDGIQRV